MRIDRRLVLIGVMLVVLSMTMATQYATTKISYTFAVVHPSSGDIRFIGSDNCSDDGIRCLRVLNNDSSTKFLTLDLGEMFPNTTTNYTSAFGIVNEENFTVNITHLNLNGENVSYFDIWLHGNRTEDYPTEGDCSTRVKVIEDGVATYDWDSCVWQLYAGDKDVSTICADADNGNPTQLDTYWDTDAHVQYSTNYANNSVNGSSDFVWVGISIDVPAGAAMDNNVAGTLFVHFESTTDT